MTLCKDTDFEPEATRPQPHFLPSPAVELDSLNLRVPVCPVGGAVSYSAGFGVVSECPQLVEKAIKIVFLFLTIHM